MTVKELSEICGVHYNTMRKWLSDNKVKKTSNTRNAKFLLTDEVISSAKKHFIKNEDKTETKQESKQETLENVLIQQVTQKDIQLVKQQEQIDHLQRLLENQQILTLKAQEKVELLENKEENKSLWHKIFKKEKAK
ncbi:hypothetical protein PT168_08560 [Erysipelothrix rhusiopathiae]|nr:hypothetical protein [Erysipelothrix rhusiopathiae]